jgi:hypothetical protein
VPPLKQAGFDEYKRDYAYNTTVKLKWPECAFDDVTLAVQQANNRADRNNIVYAD